jgi:hypothetical protein
VDRPGDPVTKAPLATPPLLLKATTCGAPLTCSCPLSASTTQPCTFAPGGNSIQSTDPDAILRLKELLVQGSNEDSNNDEAGLEKAFLYVLGEWKAGRKDSVGQVVAISDEEANDDNRICGLQASRATFVPYYQSILGAAFNPPANTGVCNADLTAFYIYAFKYLNVQVNALCDIDGSVNEISKIYPAVAAATGGHVASIGDCAGFTSFFTKVGTNTATLSTNVCFPQPIDPSTLKVTYTANGASQPVPPSATDGWTYDAALKCIVFHGTWEKAYGNYQLSFGAGSAGKVCFPPNVKPIESTIVVKVQSVVVPKSTTNGWAYDPPSNCLNLSGTWSTNKGPFDIQYL